MAAVGGHVARQGRRAESARMPPRRAFAPLAWSRGTHPRPSPPMKIRISTYSTVPRGDVVHAVSLAEALAARGHDVELWALAQDGAPFLAEPRAPTRLVAFDTRTDESDAARVRRATETLAAAMRAADPATINHTVDALSAQSLLQLRDEGVIAHVIRTIHHVDAFTDPDLLEWQRRSIVDVDVRTCVSTHWAERVAEEFGVASAVIANGVDAERFGGCRLSRAEAGARFGWGDRPVVLAVGGIEPRKGSRLLLEAFARARGRLGDDALLVIAGEGALFDAPDYREAWWRDAERLGLTVGDAESTPVDNGVDVALVGVISESLMPVLYRGADVLAFPSTREGFGMVVLEAMAGGLPAVVTDLPVLREHLTDGRDCLMVPAGDSGPLANALVSLVRDQDLRDTLAVGGAQTVARFTWERCAIAHEELYQRTVRER